MTPPFRVAVLGDAALAVIFDGPVDSRMTHTAQALADAVRQSTFPGVIDVVPTYASVGVFFDPVRVRSDLHAALADLAGAVKPDIVAPSAAIDVPVCYGGAYGPDLDEVAAFAGSSAEAVVALHTAGVYRVHMLGFAPGFAYIGDLDARIAMPRRAVPRTHVIAGSVGIAGAWTGVYPFDSPGGWQIIGRTPLRVADFGRPAPFLFSPGDEVRFRAVDAARFDQLLAETSRP